MAGYKISNARLAEAGEDFGMVGLIAHFGAWAEDMLKKRRKIKQCGKTAQSFI